MTSKPAMPAIKRFAKAITAYLLEPDDQLEREDLALFMIEKLEESYPFHTTIKTSASFSYSSIVSALDNRSKTVFNTWYGSLPLIFAATHKTFELRPGEPQELF